MVRLIGSVRNQGSMPFLAGRINRSERYHVSRMQGHAQKRGCTTYIRFDLMRRVTLLGLLALGLLKQES